MKYSKEVVNTASHSLSQRLLSNPNLIKNRMSQEPELQSGISDFSEAISHFNEVTDERIKDLVYMSVLYGFMLREEIAQAVNK